jgi:chemotaxis protein MotB
MAKRREHAEEHENHERWLVSYADFMTLLFAFFVVMYAVSRVDQKRMIDVVKGIKFAMHYKGTGGTDQLPIFEGPVSTEGGCVTAMGDQRPSNREVEAIEAVRRKIEKKLKGILLERPENPPTVLMHTEGRKLMIRLSAAHFFDPAQAAIRPEVIPVLDAIAVELQQFHRPIRIEGHTDDQTAARSRFRDNWDLSASRAASVASYMQGAHQIEGKMLSAAGRGSTWPIADNSTAQGRETNRRVELVVEVKPEDAFESLAR